MTTLDTPPKVTEPTPPSRPGPLRTVLAFLRNTWRGLTAMRTALVLLFLLALAALPGALLPQRALNDPKVDQYIASHGWWGHLLDRLQFFTVYGSVWFSAIYVLLFVSLVGCLLPRSVEYARQWFAKPVITPRNLSRLPHHVRAEFDSTDGVDEIADAMRGQLRGWRLRRDIDGEGATRTVSLSTERGFLRETGNLVFHFALLGLIVAFAIGKMFMYSGQVIVLADGSEFCNSGVLEYDSFTPGLRVDGTHLDPFCVKVNDFTARYLPTGQPVYYNSDIQYQSGEDLATNTWRPYDLKVDSPLRTAGDRIYLLGNGYAPVFTVRFPDGQVRQGIVQWKPDDTSTMLSEGATKFDPPNVTNASELATRQLAVTGLFAPTAAYQGGLLTSTYPDLTSPAVSLDIYQGDLGEGSGTGQSIFTIDQSMVADGRLKLVDKANLGLGQSTKLPDGTTVRFDSVRRWVSLQIAHDPTQVYVLVFALLMLGGLIVSLTVKRRRVWVRVSRTPAGQAGGGGRTVVEIGGLARTDQAGYGEEFTRLTARLLAAARRQAVPSGKDS
ncbi:MAG TPA: cytochrome c biogenesis protein ResB [Pseudonocardiaceae bacterium]|nr:cytochrome c biogenesis protein ResB [Pseudonocardiaceae bacterium]